MHVAETEFKPKFYTLDPTTFLQSEKGVQGSDLKGRGGDRQAGCGADKSQRSRMPGVEHGPGVLLKLPGESTEQPGVRTPGERVRGESR